jgi:Domain of unknown function (DUF4349)
MEIDWRALLARQRKWQKTVWVIIALLVAVYGGSIRPSHAFRGFAAQRATALAAIERNRHWLLPLPESLDNATLAAGVVGGDPGSLGYRTASIVTSLSAPDGLADHKLVRKSSFDLLVKHPAESAEKIRSLTERLGGFLVESQTNGAQDATNISLSMRVPAARFAEVGAEIRKLGSRVESEQLQTEDVTTPYVDQQSHLRNLRAQEAQYLTILKQAKTVRDILDVSEKLNRVRDEIEQRQSEFAVLSKQVETVAVTVLLHSEAEANMFGLRWRPIYELKLAVMQGLEGLADYATTVFSLVFYLPAILLWLATILVGAALGRKALGFGVRVLFDRKKPAQVSA